MSAPHQRRTGRGPGPPRSATSDPFAAAVKRALADDVARLAAVPAGGGATAAMATGLRRRAVGRAWLVAAVAGAMAAGALLAALASWPGDGAPSSADERATSTVVGGTVPGSRPTSAPATPAPPPPPSGDPADADAGGHDGDALVAAAGPTGGTATTALPALPAPSTAAPTSTTTTTTSPPGADPRLRVSASSDRSGSSPLGGSTLTGVVFIFWDPAQHLPAGGTVTFWIDDPSRSGPPHRVEGGVHYDLEATAPSGEAHGFDVAVLGLGVHQVTADAGAGVVVTATFTVA